MNHFTVLPTWQRLSLADESAFRSFADKRPAGYANGWLYHLRSARNSDGTRGFRILADDFMVTIGVRDQWVNVIAPMGRDRLDQTPRVCKLIARVTGLPLLLKKVDSSLAQQLLLQKEFYSADQDVNILEDESFPEQSLNLRQLFDGQGSLTKAARQLRRRVRQFEGQGIELQEMNLLRATTANFELLLREVTQGNADKRSAYSEICRYFQSGQFDRNNYIASAFVDSRNRTHGLYLVEKLGNRTAGLYCAVCSRAFRYSTEWMDVAFFRQLAQQGIDRLLLGGSETAGVHHYVQKLLPTPVTAAALPLVFRSRFTGAEGHSFPQMLAS